MVEPGSRVRVVAGPFKGSQALVRAVTGALARVEVNVFGRPTAVEVPLTALQSPDADPRPRWRAEIGDDADRSLARALRDWWLDRLDRDDDELAEVWPTARAELERRAAGRRQALLAAFDRAFSGTLRDGGSGRLRARWEREQARWLPGAAARRQRSDPAADERHLAADERRAEVEYGLWRRSRLPSAATVRTGREAGRRAAEAMREPVTAEVRRTHGLTLPEHLFTFVAFWLGLTDVERGALAWPVGILGPVGVLDRFAAPASPARPAKARDGLDHRLHQRFYRDPPEFLTVLHGDDGLRYGLWYDDPDCPPSFVASFDNRDGGGIGAHGPTLLGVVRERVERVQLHQDTGPGEEAARLHAWLVRDAVTEFETADRPERGQAYLDRWRREVRLDGRVATVAEVGVLAGAPATTRDVEVVERAVRAGDPGVQALVDAALAACAEGDPGEALALGHDLHWLSKGDPEREAWAAELLAAAYGRLGRPALAAVAAVHHARRDLAVVDLYD